MNSVTNLRGIEKCQAKAKTTVPSSYFVVIIQILPLFVDRLSLVGCAHRVTESVSDPAINRGGGGAKGP